MEIDVSTRSGVERAFGELNSAVKELREQGKLTDDKVVKIASDVETVQRASLELANRRVEVPASRDEREISKRYIKPDGSVRMTSERVTRTFAGKTVTLVQAGLLDDQNLAHEAQRDLRKAMSRRALARLMMPSGTPTPVLDGEVVEAVERLPKDARDAIEKQMESRGYFGGEKRSFNDSSTEGAEWIFDGYVPDLYRAFELPGSAASLFPTIQVQNETWKRPKITRGLRPYIANKSTDNNPANHEASDIATGDATMTVPAMAVRVMADLISVEDSALPVLQLLSEEIMRAHANGWEDVIFNGDTAATHQDTIATWNTRSAWGSTGLGGSNDHRRSAIGLRARAFDVSNTTDQSGAQTAAGHLADIATLGERAMARLGTFVSPEYMVVKMMGWAEFQTMEKFGPNATNMKGALGAAFGIPVYMTRWITADLATTGLYTGTGSYTGKIVADLDAFATYVRRGLIIKSQEDINSSQINLVGTSRRLFSTPDASSTKNVHFAYKLSSS